MKISNNSGKLIFYGKCKRWIEGSGSCVPQALGTPRLENVIEHAFPKRVHFHKSGKDFYNMRNYASFQVSNYCAVECKEI